MTYGTGTGIHHDIDCRRHYIYSTVGGDDIVISESLMITGMIHFIDWDFLLCVGVKYTCIVGAQWVSDMDTRWRCPGQ